MVRVCLFRKANLVKISSNLYQRMMRRNTGVGMFFSHLGILRIFFHISAICFSSTGFLFNKKSSIRCPAVTAFYGSSLSWFFSSSWNSFFFGSLLMGSDRTDSGIFSPCSKFNPTVDASSTFYVLIPKPLLFAFRRLMRKPEDASASYKIDKLDRSLPESLSCWPSEGSINFICYADKLVKNVFYFLKLVQISRAKKNISIITSAAAAINTSFNLAIKKEKAKQKMNGQPSAPKISNRSTSPIVSYITAEQLSQLNNLWAQMIAVLTSNPAQIMPNVPQ